MSVVSGTETTLYMGETYTFTSTTAGDWTTTDTNIDIVSGGTSSTSMTCRIVNRLIPTSPAINANIECVGNTSLAVTYNPIPLLVTGSGSLAGVTSGETINLAIDTLTVPGAAGGNWTLSNPDSGVFTSSALDSSDVDFKGLNYNNTTIQVTYTTGFGIVSQFNVVVTGIPITYAGASPLISGQVGDCSVDNAAYSFTNGVWSYESDEERQQFNNGSGVYDVATITPAVFGGTISTANFKALSYLNGEIWIVFTADNGGKGIYKLPMEGIPITFTGITEPGSSDIITGNKARLEADITYATTGVWTAVNCTMNFTHEDGMTFEDLENDTSTGTPVRIVDIQSTTTTKQGGRQISYTDNANGGSGVATFFTLKIPTTIGATDSTDIANYITSGDTYTMAVDSTQYATGGVWSSSAITILSQTSTSCTFKTTSDSGGNTLDYTWTDPVSMIAYGPCKYNIFFIGIVVTGNITPDVFRNYTYSAPGTYVGGSWSLVHVSRATVGIQSGNTAEVYIDDLGINAVIYTATNGGTGRLIINGVFNIYIPVGLNVGDPGQFKIPPSASTDSFEIGNPANTGAYLWVPGEVIVSSLPAIFNITSHTDHTCDFTVVGNGTQEIIYTYTHYDGTTVLYMDTEQFVGGHPPPIAVNDVGPYQFNTVSGGSLNPTANDNLNTGTLSALTILNYDGITQSKITVNNTYDLITFDVGMDLGTYTLIYKIETQFGESNTATFTIEVLPGPATTSEDLNIGSFNNVTGTTNVNVFTNDALAGHTILNVLYQNYIGDLLLAANVSIDLAGLLTIVPNMLPVGNYSFDYAVVTDQTNPSNYSTVSFTIFSTPTDTLFGPNSMGLTSISTETGIGSDDNIYIRNPKNTVSSAMERYIGSYTGTRTAELTTLLTNVLPILLTNGNIIAVGEKNVEHTKKYKSTTIEVSTSNEAIE